VTVAVGRGVDYKPAAIEVRAGQPVEL